MVAAAMLLVELVTTRLFSVLFYYHFSFFAVSLVMSGLALGGLLVSRWNVRGLPLGRLYDALAWLALALCGCVLLALHQTVYGAPAGDKLSMAGVALHALVFLPGLVAAGAFLAAAFAYRQEWIGKLYAADLTAAALACLSAIALLRKVQGPAVLLCPALLAALAAAALPTARRLRIVAVTMALACGVGIWVSVAANGRFLTLPLTLQPAFERWNEYSRIIAYPTGTIGKEPSRVLIIDRSAATTMRRLPASALAGRFAIPAEWDDSSRYLAYRLGRPVDRVAIIGVGGGEDLGPPLAHGASRIDGYEINDILIDLLRRHWTSFNAIATRPEIHLIHSEARVGIARSGAHYDLIQASLIDTWAATASGGFVLSENGLYTQEGWHTFLGALTDRGLLTMTRWYVPDAPAEVERLVGLASTALSDAGIADPAAHIILFGESLARTRTMNMGTIVVSKLPFSPAEIAQAHALAAADHLKLLAVPDALPADPALGGLLDPRRRAATVEASPFDISPPSDDRPYFFLQMRARDLPGLFGERFGSITEITFNSVRVMTLLTGIALLMMLAVALFAGAGAPGRAPLPTPAATAHRWMVLYFAAIGLGYLLIQLGLHQRLILLLGHPTYVLSVVLFSMLLGTGAGAALSGRIAGPRATRRTWVAIVAALAVLNLAWPLVLAALGATTSATARAVGAGALIFAIGFVLGFPFPCGVRLVAPLGEWAVQRMWAVNGAASIAGSALAAVIGLSLGSHANLVAGLGCYAVMAVTGTAALARLDRAPMPAPAPAPAALATASQPPPG
jgi:hypothetical protein